jgi:hypothetical protein
VAMFEVQVVCGVAKMSSSGMCLSQARPPCYFRDAPAFVRA